MMLLGTIVNVAGVLVGGGGGLLLHHFLHKGIPERFSDRIMKGIGLCTVYIAASSLLDGSKTLVTILSMVLGAIVGELIDLDGKIQKVSRAVEKRFSGGGSGDNFSRGLLSATLLFCVGTMAIQGSLDSGLTGDHSILLSKSMMDTIAALIFASSLGIGVLFSTVPLFLYQGGITLLAVAARPYLTAEVIAEMNTVGSLLLLGLSLDLLDIKHLKLMNYIPAMFFPILLTWFF